MKQPRVAIYSRVSTDAQTHASQLSELREFCRRREWSDPEEFIDFASGAKQTRTALDALMQQARRGNLDVVLCFKLDRLGRSLTHLAQVIGQLNDNKVALVCPSQGIDTTEQNAVGKLQLGVLMAVAEFERSILSDRVRAGIRARKLAGTYKGKPETLFKHKEGIRRHLAAGLGIRAMARAEKIGMYGVYKLKREIEEEARVAAADDLTFSHASATPPNTPPPPGTMEPEDGTGDCGCDLFIGRQNEQCDDHAAA